jgi:GAF domain-containing protein
MGEVREDLAEAFVELSDSLADDRGLADFLTTLSVRCVELLPVDTAGVLISQGDGLHPAGAATEPRVPDLLELQLPSGPSAECFQARRPLVNLDLNAERRRWPRFVHAALEAGFRSLHVLPMQRRDDIIGALNLFGASPDPLPDGDIRIGQALAEVATIAIQRRRQLRHAELLARQLQGALQSRIVIEQAKGVLAERGHLDMNQAFERLRGYARSHNRRLTDIATAVVRGTIGPDDLLG